MLEPSLTLSVSPGGLTEIIENTKKYAQNARASSTRRAMRSDWADFEIWCCTHRLPSLPSTPETIAMYLSDRASTLAVATLSRRLIAITQAHRAAGFGEPSPASTRNILVGSVLRGIRRAKGVAQPGKTPLLADDIRRVVSSCGDTLAGARDRALILVGFAGGFRRSELVRITVGHLEFCSAGVVIHVARSKTDQEGVGRKVAIPWGSDETTCPVRALSRWLGASAAFAGPVFRAVARQHVSPRGLHKDSVGFIIKRMAQRAGINPKTIAGHSLRSGHITQGSLNKISERAIMRQTGHRATKSLDRYVRVLGLFDDNSAAGLGI